MNSRRAGNESSPLLICVPGLMGDATDFDYFVPRWQDHFYVVLPVLNSHREAAAAGYTSMDENGQKRLLYEQAPRLISEFIRNEFAGRRAYFAGISLGGKITIEIAGTDPEIFAGAVVTDVGLGPLCQSEFFRFVAEVIPSINLQQSWPDLRRELTEKIPDKMLRMLVQSHIEFVDGPGSVGRWRTASLGFPELVRGTNLEDQWRLANRIQAPIRVLRATSASAIGDQDFARMQSLPQFSFQMIPGANHFIQAYQPEIFSQAVIDHVRHGEIPQ